jgi:hypothetical protein
MSQIRNSGNRRVDRVPLELADPLSAWHYLTAGFSIKDDESILTINKGLKGLPPLPARRFSGYFPPSPDFEHHFLEALETVDLLE